jgi:aspartyl-tRNA(Asn)/glutamyl-tRNA(Gln) amidotransferase subunit B
MGEKLGTRCEIKNLNSFRFMEQAIEYEARRQVELLEEGGSVVQETRLFDPDKGETRAMRTKEEAHDYRYFPDPDLLPLAVGAAQIERLRGELPELPQAMARRLQSAHSLSDYDARLITSSRETAHYFEAVAARVDAKLAANWINGELAGALNRAGLDIAQGPVGAAALGALLARIADGTLSGKMARTVFEALWAGEGEVDAIIEKRGLRQMSDAGALERIIDDVLAKNAKQVEDYRAGKDKAFNSLVGQVMKATQGKANPAQVNGLLKQKLAR